MSLKTLFDKLSAKPSATEPSAFLALPSIKERRVRIAKTLVIDSDTLSRMADALIEELDFRLVTDAPKMMAVIREAERLGPTLASCWAPYPPLPALFFFSYEAGHPSLHLLTDRLGGKALTRLFLRLHQAISVEATADPRPIVIEGSDLPVPNFSSLPPLNLDHHALLATVYEGRFYWLGTYHPGETVKTWLVRARESLRQFPDLQATFV